MESPAPLNFKSYSLILINTSAGKDSQAMMETVCREAERQDAMERVRAVHADLGRVEWPGTRELAEEHARHYGIPFHVVKRERVGDLLAEIRRRGKWPSSVTRYCTSYYKRETVKKLITKINREYRAYYAHLPKAARQFRVLNCLGFRSEESPRRKKLPQYARNPKSSCGHRDVFDYLPIQHWPLAQVWETIRRAGTRPHPAYALGMKRLSCMFCIFAPKSQLMIAGRANPELLDEYVQVEKEIGHTFRKELPIIDVRRAIEAGEQPGEDDGAWNM